MAWASQLGLLLFLLASGATGGRLLWRGLKGGGVHERLLGVAYFNGGPLGYVPLIVVMLGLTPDAWTTPLRAFGQLNLAASAFALFLFNRLVFRPASNAWRLATGLACAALPVAWIALFATGEFDGRQMGGSSAYWFDFWVRAAAYAWAGTESLMTYSRARRRLALGLADPVVANRFLLWGIAMAAITGMFANTAVSLLILDGARGPGGLLFDSVLAVITSAAMWVTFFPSRRYLAWVQGGAPAERA
jgi:hypothetical protein